MLVNLVIYNFILCTRSHSTGRVSDRFKGLLAAIIQAMSFTRRNRTHQVVDPTQLIPLLQFLRKYVLLGVELSDCVLLAINGSFQRVNFRSALFQVVFALFKFLLQIRRFICLGYQVVVLSYQVVVSHSATFRFVPSGSTCPLPTQPSHG